MFIEDRRKTDFKEFPFRDFNGSQRKVKALRSKLRRCDDGFVSQCTTIELTTLYELVCGYHDEPDGDGYVIELGSKRGGTAAILSAALRDSGKTPIPLITVSNYSIYSERGEEDYVIARRVYHETGLALKYVCPMFFDSINFLKFWAMPTRLIFLDTSHKYEQTSKEIPLALSVLGRDGWLLLHDYNEGFGVMPALNDFLDNNVDYDLEVFFSDSLACVKLIGI